MCRIIPASETILYIITCKLCSDAQVKIEMIGKFMTPIRGNVVVMRRMVVAILSIVITSTATIAAGKADKATDFFQRGEKAYFVKKYTEAMDWYERASELGNLDAKKSLALMYATGRGVEKNRAKAIVLYRKMLIPLRIAAGKNDVEALRTLAYMYRNGLGVPLSGSAALQQYKKAAELGDLASMRDISNMYDAGVHVTQSHEEAVEWLRRAAELGDARSMQKLGNRYLVGGTGVPKDRDQAIRWYQTAADFGDKTARRQLRLLGKPQQDALKLYSPSGDKRFTLVRYRGVRVDLSCFNLKENCLALRAVEQVRSRKIDVPTRTGASPSYLMCSAVGGRWQILRDASRKEYYVCSFIDKTMIDSRDLYKANPLARR